MRWLRAALVRLRGLFASDRLERELEDELDAHLRMHVDDNIRAGLAPDESSRRRSDIAIVAVCPCLNMSRRISATVCVRFERVPASPVSPY